MCVCMCVCVSVSAVLLTAAPLRTTNSIRVTLYQLPCLSCPVCREMKSIEMGTMKIGIYWRSFMKPSFLRTFSANDFTGCKSTYWDTVAMGMEMGMEMVVTVDLIPYQLT